MSGCFAFATGSPPGLVRHPLARPVSSTCSRSRPARRLVRCCASSPKVDRSEPMSPAAAGRTVDSPDDEDEVHSSWGIYEREGNPCVICLGTGKCKCLYCFGDGVVFIGPERERDEVVCPQCEGRKQEICPRCSGSGVRPSTRFNPYTMTVEKNRTNAEVAAGINAPTKSTKESDTTSPIEPPPARPAEADTLARSESSSTVKPATKVAPAASK